MIPNYLRALERDDLSQWLAHFTGGAMIDGRWLSPLDVVRSILATGRIRASTRREIAKYAPAGATCFYDVPPSKYQRIIETNPNNRQHYGLIVGKTAAWWQGGRPAIYTERPDDERWPSEDRFRLIWTDLNRRPQPVDWMHEREWRVPGDFTLSLPSGPAPFCWWWPCVARVDEANALLAEFSGLSAIYTQSNGIVGRVGGA